MTPAGKKPHRETGRKVGSVPSSSCDIDDVVLEFVKRLSWHFSKANGHELPAQSPFVSTEMSTSRKPDQSADKKRTVFRLYRKLLRRARRSWQTLGTRCAGESLEAGLRQKHDADIVFLTAMPPRHHSAADGPYSICHGSRPSDDLRQMRSQGRGYPDTRCMRGNPAQAGRIFIDDLPNNHFSVLRNGTRHFNGLHLMTAHAPLRPLLPPHARCGVIERR